DPGLENRAPCGPMERRTSMLTRILTACAFLVMAAGIAMSSPATHASNSDGVILVKSAYPMGETIRRLKHDIADKKIVFFAEIDQARLAADAGIKLRPATLLVFGNPPLGTQFIASNPLSGLAWPVRILVFQDSDGAVWTAYTYFAWFAWCHSLA